MQQLGFSCAGASLLMHICFIHILVFCVLCSFPLAAVCLYMASAVHIPCYCLYRIAFIFILIVMYYHQFRCKRLGLGCLSANLRALSSRKPGCHHCTLQHWIESSLIIYWLVVAGLWVCLNLSVLQPGSVCVCAWEQVREIQRYCFFLTGFQFVKVLMHQATENKHFGIIWLKTTLVLF